MTDENDGGSKLLWFLTGAALGAAAALVMAPQSGRETRDQIRRRAIESRERAYEASREARERGRELYEKGREVVDEASESGRRIYEKGREFYDRGRHLAEDAAARLKGEGAVKESVPPQEPSPQTEG